MRKLPEEQKRIWSYKVKNKHGLLEPYSGIFGSKKEALQWYEKHGKVLESLFDRNLILV